MDWTDLRDSDDLQGLGTQGQGWEDRQDVLENRGTDARSRRRLVGRCFDKWCPFTQPLAHLLRCQKAERRPDGGHTGLTEEREEESALSATRAHLEPTALNPQTPITAGARPLSQRHGLLPDRVLGIECQARAGHNLHQHQQNSGAVTLPIFPTGTYG